MTAGNASQLSDGASATLLMERKLAEPLGSSRRSHLRGFAVPHATPTRWASAPSSPSPDCSKRHGLKVDDIGLWELNEAFAVQVVYCRDRLGIDPNKLNVNGGSIAIGHPFGMTGARWAASEKAATQGALRRGDHVRRRRTGRGRPVRSRLTF